jgi:predicted Zn-dependent protease
MQITDRIFGYLNYHFNSSQDQELKLRSILKSYPCWGWGHYLLAKILFDNRNWSASFVSNAAARKLKVQSKLTSLLDAKIYMQVGRPGDAINVLLQLTDQNKTSDLEIIEELVAAYMQMEDYAHAAKVFESINSHTELSPGLKVAKEFIATKVLN